MTTGLSAPPQEWFSQQVEDLRSRVEEARARGAGQDVAQLIEDLETAVEELHVAEEEVRSQGEEVARLLKNRDLVRWRYERVSAALPVAVLTTDRHGRLRSVNPSAAALFGLRVDHLLRKPLFVFLDEPDRQTLRRALSQARQGTTPQPCSVTLRVRHGAVAVVVYVGAMSSREREVSWLLLDREGASTWSPPDPDMADPASKLPAALLALANLSAHSLDVGAVLQQVVGVCADALGPDAAVGICVGHPLSPGAVATTSSTLASLDGWQIQTDEGPAVTAYDSGRLTTSSDLLSDDRWPHLQAAESSEPSPGGCVCVPLLASDEVCGVLTVVLPPGRSAATPSEVHVIETLGAAVASLIQDLDLRSAMQSLVDDMRAALTSRAVIDQAKGIVMADLRCSADEAFQHLVRISNKTHQKVRDVAQLIVDRVSPPDGEGQPTRRR